jgi:hypothetical protein
VDVFKPSRPWVEVGPGPFAYDPDGNPLLKPGQSVWTLMFRGLDGEYPAGAYVCTYKGKGTVDMSKYDVKKVVRQKPGRIEADVAPADGGIQLTITASDPQDPVRDIHVWMPGFEDAKTPFHPTFLKRLDGFGVLRFMDWGNVNNSTVKSWDQRAKPSDVHWASDAGVPLEAMIDLANARQADPWFCIPHLADDDYVAHFARTVKERLDPKLKVYVEYSNEVWNWGFKQTKWADEQGKALKLGGDQPLARYYAQRSVEVFKIWEKEFGGRDRLVRVLANQFANPWLCEQVLTWKDAYKNADALAVAPYFGNDFDVPAKSGEVLKMGAGGLLDAVEKEVNGSNKELMKKQAALAKKYGLQLVAYEGGQHLVGVNGAQDNKELTDLFIAANRDPRMGALYKQHLANWVEAGGGLYVAYSYVYAPNKWGSWGVLEYQTQPAEKAPKYQALLDFIESRKKSAPEK